MKTGTPMLLLLLACGSANAAMYSCVNEAGEKRLTNHQCEPGEKRQEIRNEAVQSYSMIYSTGERQYYHSRAPEEFNPVRVRFQDAGQRDAASEACEKMRKELDGLVVKNLGGALVKRGLERDYEISCVLPPEARSAAIEERKLNAMIRQQNMPTPLEVYEKMSREQQLNHIENTVNKLDNKLRYGY